MVLFSFQFDINSLTTYNFGLALFSRDQRKVFFFTSLGDEKKEFV